MTEMGPLVASTTASGSVDEVTRAAPPAQSRLLKALLMILLIVLLGIGVGALRYRAWAAKQQEFLAVGTSLYPFFSAYSKDFKSMDKVLLASAYADDARVNFLALPGEVNTFRGVSRVSYQPMAGRPPNGVSQQISRYFANVAGIDDARFKLNRLFGYEFGKTANIRVRFQVWGRLKDGIGFYDSGLLSMHLEKDPEGSWEIRSQDIIDAQRILKPSNTLFRDVSEQSGLMAAVPDMADLDEAVKNWRFSVFSRLPRGVAVADVDGDGTPDIFIAGNRNGTLWLNDGHGHFREASGEWGLGPELTSFSTFPLFVDLDNDGKPDLLLLRLFGQSRLFRNTGSRFVDVTAESGLKINGYAMTASFADYDNDGLLDLFIGNYGNAKDDTPETVVRSRNGQPAQLFRNLGNFRFQDVTQKAGINSTGWALASSFFDVNEDGRPDIYIANDFGYNSLYLNNGDGTFTETSWRSGTFNIASNMSVSLLDYDGDGKLDIYTSGIAANTVWFQGPGLNYLLTRFLTNPSTFRQTLATFIDLGLHVDREELPEIGYRASDGNNLLKNTGGGTFRHVETDSGTAWAEWAWGTAVGDVNCDGMPDIFVANGFITGPDKNDF